MCIKEALVYFPLQSLFRYNDRGRLNTPMGSDAQTKLHPICIWAAGLAEAARGREASGSQEPVFRRGHFVVGS